VEMTHSNPNSASSVCEDDHCCSNSDTKKLVGECLFAGDCSINILLDLEDYVAFTPDARELENAPDSVTTDVVANETLLTKPFLRCVDNGKRGPPRSLIHTYSVPLYVMHSSFLV